MKGETSQLCPPDTASKKRRTFKMVNLPAGTLTLLATIAFLSLNYHCLSVEGYEHHRWRHRDRSAGISHLPHHSHLPLVSIGIGSADTRMLPATVATTTAMEDRNEVGAEDEEEEESEEEESEAKDSSSSSYYSTRRSSLEFGLCSRCPPGFGVARRCTLVQDTVCHSCPQSYYAPSYSRKHACWPCSKCGEGLYVVQPCTATSDTVCQACLRPSARHFAGTDKSQVANGKDYRHLCGHHQHHRSKSINNGDGPSSSSSQQRNLLSTLTIGDNNKNKRTTSGNVIHFLNHPAGGGPAAITNNNSSTQPPTTFGSFPSDINAESSSAAEEDEVALGVAQLAAFQVVLIFTAVAAILALTCRLRVFSSHEPARLKLTETYRDDGVALIEQLSES